jgi:DNA-binding CsgD family transcriptional regulator
MSLPPQKFGLTLSEQAQKKINEIVAVSTFLPGVVVVHQLPEFTLQYMSPEGLRLLDKTWDDIKDLSSAEYHARFFNPEDAQHYLPKILGLFERNTDETVTYFQQVRTAADKEWEWYLSMTKILMRTPEGKPHLMITVAMRIDPTNYFTAKGARMLEENNFLRTHYHQYARLGKREQEILRLMVLGKTAAQISKSLSISVATVETHRKNIKQKLGTNNRFELSQYARAFDLV